MSHGIRESVIFLPFPSILYLKNNILLGTKIHWRPQSTVPALRTLMEINYVMLQVTQTVPAEAACDNEKQSRATKMGNKLEAQDGGRSLHLN